jgi:GT2 family glycosyltransferase
MISVIIPTMWKPEHIDRMLPILNGHPLIGEIIIIDNDRSKTKHDLLKKIDKLVYYCFEEGNIFVNPAWNFGAKIAKYDKLFFLNDDCLVNLTALQTIYDEITEDKGILGFSALSYCTYTIDAYDTLASSGFGVDVYIEPIDPREYPHTSGMPHMSYGSAMFMHKKNYTKIPDDFRIYYGDLFIYVTNLKNGLHNYIIENGLVVTHMSTTVNTVAKDILVHEGNILRDKFAEYGLKGIKYQIPRRDF